MRIKSRMIYPNTIESSNLSLTLQQLAYPVLEFRADGYLRAINDLDKIVYAYSSYVFTKVYILKEIGGTSGSTSIRITKNGSSFYTDSINYNQESKVTESLSLSVAYNDILALDLVSIEVGEPQNLSVFIGV